ncbi:hypothetical protein J5X98_25945 [Leptothermofonsia sichuanensis E412]|uniref:hypothetical protein n=1 Tax=Leptothermofonsia sichuanensis TaxID=2917832 RepID=UPI001CA60D4B|nr:hypothetical protein [Leptothermofonsia sichuanensis]QZZ20630.1 hypothetical protein J5X98_25945 [Leptothermofonsia sichuanensis E412]
MYDNKVRLSQDVLEKATLIASEWGLKNARAAVEAVFRKYADEYLHGSRRPVEAPKTCGAPMPPAPVDRLPPSKCEALDELDELLGL